MNKEPINVLQDQFKISSFRQGQAEIIDTILTGEDVLGIMPTGAGKSLCYQIPSLIFDGVSIIISPLIALMKDQVDTLHSLKIPATFINSTLTLNEAQQRLNDVRRGYYKLLYIAPERFYAANFMKLINQIDVSFIAIDEAHCISQWGHDFRPSYLKLKSIIKMIGSPPVAAFTATATKEVREDILIQLGIPDAKVFISGFDRPNLKYFAVNLSNEEKEAEMLRILPTIKNSGIVYVSTQRAVESITNILNNHQIKAAGYHGGMDKVQRHEAQDQWLNNDISVIVATNAFGMGIDKYDVRFVLHYNMPGSLEAYYQEAGRAGRDGKTSYCFLFYNYSDRKLQEFFIENNYPPKEILENIYNFLFNLEREDIYLTYREIGETCGANEMSVASGIKLFEQYNILQRMNKQTVTIQVDFIFDQEKALLKVKRADIQKKIIQWLLPHDSQPVPLEKLLEDTNLSHEQFNAAIREIEHKGILIYTPPFRGRGIKLTSTIIPWDKIGIDFNVYEKRRRRQLEKLDILEQYIERSACRRKYILNYFGDKYNKDNCHACDICLNWHPKTTDSSSNSIADVTGNKKTILSCIEEFNDTYGVTTIANLLNGSDNERFSKLGLIHSKYFSALNNMELKKIIALTYHLIREGRIIKSDDQYPVLSINENFTAKNTPSVIYRKTQREKELPQKSQNYNRDLFTLLKRLRLDLSGDLPPYFVCSDESLREMSAYFPQTLDELINIKGIGLKKVEKYGDRFLKIINDYTKKYPELKNQAPTIELRKFRRKKKKSNRKNSISTTVMKSYQYFHGGFSIKDTAQMLSLPEQRIVSHLMRAIEIGYQVDINREVPRDKQQTILDKAKEIGFERLKPIKEALPDSYSYDEIKLTLAGKRNLLSNNPDDRN